MIKGQFAKCQMSKIKKIVFIAVILGALLIQRRSLAGEEWNNRMRRLAAVIMHVLPLTASERDFNDSKNADDLNQSVNELSSITKEIVAATNSKNKKTQDQDPHLQDPLFGVLATAFAEDAATIKELLPTKNRSYAQHLLRTATTYCTTCHTRTESQSSFKFPVFPNSLSNLSVLEKMKLYVAARQFETALQVFDAYLITGEAEKLAPLEIEKTAKLALAIAIRVENTPAHALKTTKKLQSLKNPTPAFKIELAAWEKALNKQQSLPNEKNGLDEAKALMKSAEASEGSKESEINYLRASAALHKYIGAKTKGLTTTEALYLLGTAYDKMQSLGFWDTSEVYYEACIRSSPHTELAAKCFSRYNDIILIGYTGSSGTHIPPNVCSHLRTLARLSTTKGQADDSRRKCP